MRGIKVAGGYLMKHWRENGKVFPAYQRYFNVVPLGNRPIKIPRCFDTNEASAQNNDPHHSALIRNNSIVTSLAGLFYTVSVRHQTAGRPFLSISRQITTIQT